MRFEDLLFEPRAVAGAVCDCLGGVLASEADFKIDGQKTGKGTAFGHAGDTNSRAQALALYGSSVKRMEPYAVDDVAFVRASLTTAIAGRLRPATSYSTELPNLIQMST